MCPHQRPKRAVKKKPPKPQSQNAHNKAIKMSGNEAQTFARAMGLCSSTEYIDKVVSLCP